MGQKPLTARSITDYTIENGDAAHSSNYLLSPMRIQFSGRTTNMRVQNFIQIILDICIARDFRFFPFVASNGAKVLWSAYHWNVQSPWEWKFFSSSSVFFVLFGFDNSSRSDGFGRGDGCFVSVCVCMRASVQYAWITDLCVCTMFVDYRRYSKAHGWRKSKWN